MRKNIDLKNAFDLIKKNKEVLNIFSVSKPHRNPYFNIVEKENGYNLVKKGSFNSTTIS